MPEAANYTEESLYKYLTARILLLYRELEFMGTVNQHKHDANGNPVGVSDSNPIPDTRKYRVHFDDVIVKEYSANVIYESIYSRVYDNGNEYCLLEEVVNH